MTRKTLAGIVIMAALAQAAPLLAQDGPAEAPPEGFSGRQYVDSRGCVFLRAEVAGDVEWVPRLTAAREPLCGFRPTAEAAEDTPAAAAEAPAQAAQARPEAPATPAPPADPDAAPMAMAAPGAAAPAVPPAAEAAASAETSASPAPAAPAAAAAKPARSAKARVRSPARKVAKRAARPTQPEAIEVIAPTDGQGVLAWSVAVPHRLIDTRTGQAVGAAHPGLLFPYTDLARQKRDLATGSHVVVRLGSGERRVVARSRLHRDGSGQTLLKLGTPARTRAVPLARALPARGYVQVATFAVPANATRTAARMRAAGYPVQVVPVRQGGAAYRVVLLGPFADRQGLAAGLGAARRAGFGDAFAR